MAYISVIFFFTKRSCYAPSLPTLQATVFCLSLLITLMMFVLVANSDMAKLSLRYSGRRMRSRASRVVNIQGPWPTRRSTIHQSRANSRTPALILFKYLSLNTGWAIVEIWRFGLPDALFQHSRQGRFLVDVLDNCLLSLSVMFCLPRHHSFHYSCGGVDTLLKVILWYLRLKAKTVPVKKSHHK